MNETHIIEPLIGDEAELIVEVSGEELYEAMISDVKGLSDEIKRQALSAMLHMHKYFEEECGDLDVSLNSVQEIKNNTESWYVILDGSSSLDQRAVRFHYRANWETSHGVEVIVLNGNKLIFVGNCGYVSSINNAISGADNESNFMASA